MKKQFAALTMTLLGTAVMAQTENTASVMNWWTSGSESKALRVVIQQFEAQGGVWKNLEVSGSPAARAAGVVRAINGNPPSAILWGVGIDLQDFGRHGFFANLDAVAEEGRWKAVLPKLLLDSISVDGHLMAVPFGVSADNWMYFNKAVYAKLKLQPPRTWDEFLADAPTIKAAGIVPLALGGQPWQVRIMFNDVLIGVAGKSAYLRLYKDHDASVVREPGGQKALQTFFALKAFVDEGSPGRDWNVATKMVISGKAAMQVMGDWAKGEFSAAGLTPGKEFGCAMAPGNQSAYSLNLDSFVFPKQGGRDAATPTQAKLARAIMDPKVQLEYSRYKGSVPARTDSDVSSFDECVKLGLSVLKISANQLPSFDLLLSGAQVSRFETAYSKIWDDKTMDVAKATALIAAAVTVQK